MKRCASTLLRAAVLLGAAAAARGAESAAQLVEAMRAARVSAGFEIRLTVRAPGTGSPGGTTRLALIGQSDAEHDRLLVRAIAPAWLRDRAIVSERLGERIVATAFGPDAAAAPMPADPTAGLFGSGLVVWDLMAPWWNWPDQVAGPARAVAGHACTELRSRPDPHEAGVVREVVSCVDPRIGLAWLTLLFDDRHQLLRSIEVTRDMRTQGGAAAARSATITDGDGGVTLVDVYGGDEQYQIRPHTFDTAPAAPATRG